MARSNDAAAQMLQEFAELLAISGGDPFRVRSYEKAARSVAGYHAEIAGLGEKGLDAIPNVGSHLAAKIVEFRITGSVEELDELRATVPAGLRTLLAVPGLGPKRARQVYDQLSITSVSELLDALHAQRLQTLHGCGERSEANLAQAIHDAHSSGGRIGLAVALDLAEQLLAELTALPAVHRAAYAGSLRRMRETVGDIDLLVTSGQPESVMRAFSALPLVARVLAHGPTKSSIVTTKGVQVDLRVVEPAVWGTALMYSPARSRTTFGCARSRCAPGSSCPSTACSTWRPVSSSPRLPKRTSTRASDCPGSNRHCARTAARSRRHWPANCPT